MIENTFVVMDVAGGEYGDVISELVSSIENGRLIYQANSTSVISTQSLDPGKYLKTTSGL